MNAVTEKKSNGAVAEVQERNYVAPDVNIYETAEGYVIQAEMPGVPKDAIDVTLENNTLSFVGHRKTEAVTGHPLYRESRQADFRRVFELDPAVDPEKVSAEMRQGVLTLTLPKAERVKPRKITIS